MIKAENNEVIFDNEEVTVTNCRFKIAVDEKSYLISQNEVVEALQQHIKRKENNPLTIDELMEMNGKPVYIKHLLGSWRYDGWHIVDSCVNSAWGLALEVREPSSPIGLENYGKVWLAYRYEPI